MAAQQIIFNAFILAMLMQAISAIFAEGMILSWPGAWLERNAHFVWKMLVGCPVCMCPWYGAGIILTMHLTPVAAISIGVAMGINWVISNLYPIDQGTGEGTNDDTIFVDYSEPNEPIHTTTGL